MKRDALKVIKDGKRLQLTGERAYDWLGCGVVKGKKSRYFQEPLFQELRKDTCYVCCRKIRENKGICVGQGLWRHHNCKPGSRRWSDSSMDSRRARTDVEP